MLQVVIGEQMIRFGKRLGISFHRTLRIPEDQKRYPLPPGLGRFPIYKVSDYQDRLPRQWQPSAAGFIAMYQCEALWIGLNGSDWKPNAVVIAVGGINAVSGEPVEAPLCAEPQNYLVAPPQPWLDGIHSEDGVIRQFIAWPLGDGRTVEAAVSEAESRGGIQIMVFEPKPDRFAEQAPDKNLTPQDDGILRPLHAPLTPMGLGAGGRMKQKIYRDPYGIDTWDQNNFGAASLYIVNSLQFQQITGRRPLPTPVNAKLYTEHGLPWFELYDEAMDGISASERFSRIYGGTESSARQSEEEMDSDAFPIPSVQIKPINPRPFDRTKSTSHRSAGKKDSSADESDAK